MKKGFGLTGIILLCSLQTASAKTPAQLMTDLAGIIPSGMKARIVWAQGASNSRQLFGVSSEDGVVKQLSTGSLDVDWPCLSRDGSRVFFFDLRSGEVKILSWSTGATTTLQANYVDGSSSEVSLESWVDPSNNSEWVVVGKTCGGEIGRINVDNPSQCVKLWTCGSPCPSYGDGIALSLDGTRLGAMWSLNGDFASGVGTIQGASVKRHSTWIGCGVSMPADNTYRVSFAAGDGSQQEIRISTGVNPYTVIPALATVRSAMGSGSAEMQNHRWTNDPDYLSVCMGSGKSNPFLYKVSTNKCIAIQDNLSSVRCDHSDVCFYKGTSVTPRDPHGLHGGIRTPGAARAAYGLDGRRIDASGVRGTTPRLVVGSVEVGGAVRLKTFVIAE